MKAGDVLAVRLQEDLFGAIWLTGVDGNQHSFLVLGEYWDTPPTPAQVKTAALSDPPFQRGGVLDEGPWKCWFEGVMPESFTPVGKRALSGAPASARDASGTMVFPDARAFAKYHLSAYRWFHDREALEAEWAAARNKRAEKKAPASLEEMERETPFSSWKGHVPAAVITRVRRIFRDATRALRTLEEGGTRKQRLAVFKRIVEELNALDENSGFIESVERDQLAQRIEQLGALVGLDNKNERLLAGRLW